MISRSWKVPAVRSTRPFAWGDSAKISCVPSSSMARPNWVGVPGGLIFRTVFEDSVPVGVQGERNAAAPEQSLHQQEVTAGILMIAKQGARHTACGIVHREQDRELRSVLAQPPVATAIQLDQHAFPGHPLPAHRCLGGRLRRGLLSPALTRMRRSVVRSMSRPSRSLSNSERWVWLAPSYTVRAR